MASNNIGKTFEQEFKECVPPDYYLYRLKDDTSGFYGVSNPCDYILFRSPYLFLVELKTHKGKSIPIAKIRPNQIQGMEKARRKLDVRAAAAVGMTPPQDKMVPELKEDNNLHGLPLFYLQGGAAPEKLRGMKKLMFQMAVKMTKKAASANEEKDRSVEETLRVMETGGDFVSMENLKELLIWLKEEQTEREKE